MHFIMAKKWKAKTLHNNEKSTWENTSKEQISLMPGTSEYEEYVSDLKMHDPFKPDDSFHEQQEEHNESIPVVLKDRSGGKNDTTKYKYNRQMQKDAQFKTVKSTLITKAKRTPSKDDDELAERLERKSLEDLVYDDGVDADEFLPKILRKY